MLVVHHTDNDGYCCAAIAKNYLVMAYDIPAEDDFITMAVLFRKKS